MCFSVYCLFIRLIIKQDNKWHLIFFLDIWNCAIRTDAVQTAETEETGLPEVEQTYFPMGQANYLDNYYLNSSSA